jgi:hypothetical protein
MVTYYVTIWVGKEYRMSKQDPAKMTRTVRILWETAHFKHLAPKKLARFLGVSHMQIYRWYAGEEPRRSSELKILKGLDRINEEIPDPPMEKLPSGAEVSAAWWSEDDPRNPAQIEERKFKAEMKGLFQELQRRLTPVEKHIIFGDREIWPGFVEVMGLVRKYRIKLPRI